MRDKLPQLRRSWSAADARLKLLVSLSPLAEVSGKHIPTQKLSSSNETEQNYHALFSDDASSGEAEVTHTIAGEMILYTLPNI